MTVLRRMAQLVSDLRELGVIKSNDKVNYHDDGKDFSIELRVSNWEDAYTIVNSFKEEFKNVKYGSCFENGDQEKIISFTIFRGSLRKKS